MSALSFAGSNGSPVSGIGEGAGAGAGAMAGGPWGAIIGAGLGLGNYFLHDKPQAEYNRRVQVAREMGSPWTSMHGAAVNNPSMLGDVLSFGGTGMSTQQAFENASQQQAINNALKQNLEAQTEATQKNNEPAKELPTAPSQARAPASKAAAATGKSPYATLGADPYAQFAFLNPGYQARPYSTLAGYGG